MSNREDKSKLSGLTKATEQFSLETQRCFRRKIVPENGGRPRTVIDIEGELSKASGLQTSGEIFPNPR